MKKHGKDYIIFPLDFPAIEQAQHYVTLLDGHVGMFKIGLELFIGQGPAVIEMVKRQSSAKVFLDLKLHDISATVYRAMQRVAELGIDLVTVHCSSSVQMLQKAVMAGGEKAKVLGVTLLTDNDSTTVESAGFKQVFVDDPHTLVMHRAKMAYDAGCAGIVCSGKEVKQVKQQFGNDFLAVTPGIRPEWTLLESDDQKRVTTPKQAIESGSDYIVIGRPIRDADDPVKAAQKVIKEIETALLKL